METKTQITITAKELENMFGDDYNSAIKHIESLKPLYPKNPIKPYLVAKHTAEDALEYSKNLSKYEKDNLTYRAELKEYNIISGEYTGILEEYIREISGLNSIVPEQYRDKVWRVAYSDGHSSGYGEVRNKLYDLIEIFE